MRNETIIIPALEPTFKMIRLIEGLRGFGFDHIIVVDDGSCADSETVFNEAVSKGCVLLRHKSNQGKGAAIKSALKKHIELYGPSVGVITVDADGQHLPEDVVKISEAMSEHPGELILGTRDFSGEEVPWKSRYGNKITSLFFRFSTGVRCDDTQTGLRGIPGNLLELAESEDGNRYEYEMHFLEDAVKIAECRSVPITTVYEEGNACSHFRPFRDSLRIYSRPIKYAASSLTGAAVDILVFFLVIHFYGPADSSLILAATVLSRFISGAVNFMMNKYWSFNSDGKLHGEAAGYGALFIIQMFISAFLVGKLSLVIDSVIAKIIVDCTLFVISYNVQKKYIFGKGVNKMSKWKKRPVWAVSFSILLVGYTTFTLLDAFVIPHDTVKLSEVQSSDTSETGGFKIANDDGDSDTAGETKGPGSGRRGPSGNRDSGGAGGGPGRHKGTKPGKKPDGKPGEESDNTTKSTTDNSKDSQAKSLTKNTNNSLSGNTSTDDMTYSSDKATIKIIKKYVNNTYVYIADVQLKDTTAFKSAVAENTLGRNITAKTSEIASDANAILAINGDFYGFRDSGYVMRNGYLYRSESSGDDCEDLVVYSDGKMEIIKEGDITAEELEKKGAVQIYSFGPGLIKDGEIAISEDTEVDQSMRSNPRTAIGYYSDTHYCFVVSDGRTDESEGLSLYQLAELMKDLGVSSAYNLDGGGSSTMYFNGEVINNPTTNGNKISERKVSDIICITK